MSHWIKKNIKLIKKKQSYLLFFLFLISGLALTLYVEYKFQYAQFKWLGWRVLIISGAIVQFGALKEKVRKRYIPVIIKLLILFFFLYLINFFANSINIYHLDKFDSVTNFCRSNIQICSATSFWFFKLRIYRYISLTSYFFFYVMFLLAGLLFSEKIYDKTYKIWQKIPKVKLKYAWLFYFLMTYLIFQQMIAVFSVMSKKTVKMIDTLRVPFEQRWEPVMGGRFSFGWIDTYSEFVNSKVSENSTILIPDQTAPWEMEGNKWYFRWFVYPRDLVQMEGSTEIPEEADYALISYGVFGYHKDVFPNFFIAKEKIEKIILVDQETLEELVIIKEDFDPENYQNKWGVIKFK